MAEPLDHDRRPRVVVVIEAGASCRSAEVGLLRRGLDESVFAESQPDPFKVGANRRIPRLHLRRISRSEKRSVPDCARGVRW